MPNPVPALQAYLEQQYGGSFYVNNKTVSVGATATKIVDNNFERMGLLIMNLGSAQLTISPNQNVVSGTGILLLASGSSYSVDAINDLALPGYDFYGVVASGSQDVFALEIIRYQSGA